jgi:hypothetical protein
MRQSPRASADLNSAVTRAQAFPLQHQVSAAVVAGEACRATKLSNGDRPGKAGETWAQPDARDLHKLQRRPARIGRCRRLDNVGGHYCTQLQRRPATGDRFRSGSIGAGKASVEWLQRRPAWGRPVLDQETARDLRPDGHAVTETGPEGTCEGFRMATPIMPAALSPQRRPARGPVQAAQQSAGTHAAGTATTETGRGGQCGVDDVRLAGLVVPAATETGLGRPVQMSRSTDTQPVPMSLQRRPALGGRCRASRTGRTRRSL